METLAQIFAEAAHKGQVRKYTGEPYIAHPARVVDLLKLLGGEVSGEMIAAAWLHDVIEDTPSEYRDLADAFGDVVATLVVELTKPNEPCSATALTIKACDLIDNIGGIFDVAPKEEAEAYLVKKAPQIERIVGKLRNVRPLLAEALDREYLAGIAAVA